MKPLPLIYQSNGNAVLFKDYRDIDSDYMELNRIHTPKEIVKMLGIKDFYAGLPVLRKKGLRDCQYKAITELENSFRSGQNKALMVLATGAGKTYTACLAAYRFLTCTPMKRILFLVDRNNLGKQAEGEFGMFRLTENGDPFNTIFTVNRLRSSKVPQDSNVIISTIQRLFSLLSGEVIEDTDEEEDYQNIIKRSRVEIGVILHSMIGRNIGNLIRICPHNYFDMATKNVAFFKPYQNGNINTEYIAFFLESSAIYYSQVTHFICKNTKTNQTVEYNSLYLHYKIALKNEAK